MKHELSKMLEMAFKLCEDEKYIQALQYYKNILRIEPDNVGVIIDYGVTLQNLGRLRQALEMYERALSIEPKNLHAQILHFVIILLTYQIQNLWQRVQLESVQA